MRTGPEKFWLLYRFQKICKGCYVRMVERFASATGETACPVVLGSATCSVPDFVRTELRTMLAITFGDRIGKAMQPVASRKQLRHPSLLEV